MSEQSGITEETKEVLSDKEHSLGERAPGTPFAMVALSYLVALTIGCAIVAFFIWATSSLTLGKTAI